MTSTFRLFCASLLLIGCLKGKSQAAESWPVQPYNPPDLDLRGLPVWPGDAAAAKARWPREGFCIQPGIVFVRPSVKRGGLLASWQGLFFHSRQDLDLFESPSHAIGAAVRILPRGHPLLALEDIPGESAGGRVRDELFGDGFARWPRGNWEKFPDWMELFHEASGVVCDGHALKRYVIRPGHQAFRRPHWPAVRNAHEHRKIMLKQGGKPIRVERDF